MSLSEIVNKIRNLTDDIIMDWLIYNVRLVDWLHTQFYKIKGGIKSILFWLPVVYKDRWWDHSYLYRILRHKLYQIETEFISKGVAVHTENELKKIKICYLLLDRLANDDYSNIIKEKNIRKSFEKEEYMIKQDLDLLFNIMRKNIRTWWD